jgi:hypothetical protein
LLSVANVKSERAKPPRKRAKKAIPLFKERLLFFAAVLRLGAFARELLIWFVERNSMQRCYR